MSVLSRSRKAVIGYAILTAAVFSLIGFAVAYVYMPASASGSTLRTATVVTGNVETTETATGNISSASTATVGFPIAGTLTEVNVSIGSKVTAGEILAKINPDSAETALSAAKAALLAADENLTTAENGGSAASKTSDQSSLENAQSTLTNDEEQLVSDNEDLTAAKRQLTTDENLGCPAASSSTVTSAVSGTTSSASSQSGGALQSSGAAGSTSTSIKASLIKVGLQTVFYMPNNLINILRASLLGKTAGSYFSSLYLLSAPVTTTASPNTQTLTTQPTTTTLLPATTSTTTTTAAPTAPIVTTGAVSNVMTGQVTLNATISPGGAATSYYFAWGPTDKLTNHTPVETITDTLGMTNVSTTLTGLKIDTNYLFQIVASNSVGTTKGLAELFTTASSSCVEEKTIIVEDELAIAKQKTTITEAKTNLAATKASIAQSNQTTNVQVATDEATVAEDQATVTTDEKNLQDTTLTAPISGTITSLNGSVGESVSAYASASGATGAAAGNSGRSSLSAGSSTGASSSSTSGFATITNLNNFQVIASLAEADISQVKVGQHVTITLPAIPNLTVAGKVAYISDTSTVSSNVVTYAVTIQVISPPPSVKDGMTADVSIDTGSADNVLTVPSSAITTNGSVSTVTTYANGVKRTQQVKIGLIGSSTTQIISGLNLGESVVLPTIQASASSGTSSSLFGGATTGGGAGRFGGGGFGGIGRVLGG